MPEESPEKAARQVHFKHDLQELLPDSPTREAAYSLVPLLGTTEADERKAEYLALRACGFSVREAARMVGADLRAVIHRWRKPGTVGYDPKFVELEQQVTTANRHLMRREVLHLQFTRNLMLMFRKDADIMMKWQGLVHDADGNPQYPTKDEMKYITTARSQYSAQQLQVLDEALDPTKIGDFDFSKFVKEVAASGNRIRVGIEVQRGSQESSNGQTSQQAVELNQPQQNSQHVQAEDLWQSSGSPQEYPEGPTDPSRDSGNPSEEKVLEELTIDSLTPEEVAEAESVIAAEQQAILHYEPVKDGNPHTWAKQWAKDHPA